MAEDDPRPAFFTRAGDDLVPGPHARSPWAADMLHGRLVGGLAAMALEAEHAAPGLHPARLTVDMFRNTPLVPVRVTTTRVRDGRRIRVADAHLVTDRGPIGRASVVFLRRGGPARGEVWAPEPWAHPPLSELGEPARGGAWDPPFDLWWLGGFRSGGSRGRAWLRETHPLVAGEPVSPFVRAALAADFTSPLSNGGSAGLEYINADYTLALSRLPLGEAIGLESTGHLADEGVAIGHCAVYDESGPIGHCTVTALANGGLSTAPPGA
ncbi:hypothetical protein HNP84_001641 [Thermocatellispora tengchongensis]|uniref:Thioesterase family protein n=1 Tax=Thermocatellispora tengchongensis TaxID=1073253 RepID=A0A840NWN0_9ACTN|nr:acyl-CoA thioesterase domain-containing protein [Thermocatellispora tengchongensis]MBB5131928.1 hypothetical protein [Thermocatellispora tengchongensis]